MRARLLLRVPRDLSRGGQPACILKRWGVKVGVNGTLQRLTHLTSQAKPKIGLHIFGTDSEAQD